MKNSYELIIFDLDGTIIDTSKNIYNCVRYAEKKCGFERKTDEVIKSFYGPSPKRQYEKIYGVSEQMAIMATKYHREYSKNYVGTESVIYKDVDEVLKVLKRKKFKLAVATLKNQKIAKKLLTEKGLSCYFNSIVGMDDKENYSKSDVINLVIKNFCAKDKILYVGDTLGDMESAKEIGIDFLGVTYGYGFTKESKLDNKIDFFSELLNLF